MRVDGLVDPALQAQGVAELVERLGGVGVVRAADPGEGRDRRTLVRDRLVQPARVLLDHAQARRRVGPAALVAAALLLQHRAARAQRLSRGVERAAAPQGVAEVDEHLGLQVRPPGPAQHVQRAAVGDDGGGCVVGAVQHVPEPVVGVGEHGAAGKVVRVDGRLQQRDRLAVQLQGGREPARGVEHLTERAGQPALDRGTADRAPAPCSRRAARSTCSAAG